MHAMSRIRPDEQVPLPVRRFAAGTGLVALTFLVYVPAMGGGFVWDDDAHFLQVPAMVEPGGLWKIWTAWREGPTLQYYPLLFSTFWVQVRLWGLDNPLPYHVVNVAFQAANAIMFWLLLRRLRVRAAWVAAAVFAVHPVHVESVAWITELKNLQSTLFYLLAVLAYLRFDESGVNRWYATSLLLFACALLSKTVTCSLPVALIFICWWRGRRVGVREIAQLVPFFALGLAMSLVTRWWEIVHVAAEGEAFQMPLPARLIVASRALLFYAGKLLWPHPIIFIYPRWQIAPSSPVGFWPAAVVATIVAAAMALSHRLGRGIILAPAYFVVTLFPALGFFNVAFMRFTFVQDHFQYLASLGLIALYAAGGAWLLGRLGVGRALAIPLVAAILAVLGAFSWKQAGAYQDAKSLWYDTLAKNPNAWMARINLGSLLMMEGRYPEAIVQFRPVLNARQTFGEKAKAHFGIAQALHHLGRPAEAYEHIIEAVRYRPDSAEARYIYGLTLAALGRADEAIEQFRHTIRLEPRPEAHNNLGRLLLERGEVSEAIEHLRAALRLRPGHTRARFNLCEALARQRRYGDVIRCLREGIQVGGGEVGLVRPLAWWLATSPDAQWRDGAEAVRLAEAVLRSAPADDAESLDVLAAAYAEVGRFPEAVETALRAVASARRQGRSALAADIEARLASYRAGRPYHQP